MGVLSGDQRRLLESVVVSARGVVETACAQRVAALGVDADKAPAVLTDGERSVRVGLRARARQLGSVEALVTEAGFEHWHRMLFARFLADNELLVDPQFQVPVSMDEVAEFAAESGEADVWEVAARFASEMLPGIFGQGDPILQMMLPVETRQELEGLLDQLPVEVITADDALGWVYQYWQSRRKDEVNKSERKIGGADLAPVTQLFTEDYMVRFLLENSLGAWWAARHPDSPLLAGWEYLRRNDDGAPAVGGFEQWPETVAEVTVMDPCCGSGHFLTAAFGMLWRMRAEEEGLSDADAQDAVLRDNLFGLELDARCTQIAMFALALEAWKAGGYRELPLPNVACSGIPARAPLSHWLTLAGGDDRVEAALTRLHALFANADTLGSLIDPVRAAEQAGLESVDWDQIAPLVQKALTAEAGKHGDDPAAAVFGEAAAGIARAADYLSRQYVVIAANPPWLGASQGSPLLREHMKQHFPECASELALGMTLRCSSLTSARGSSVLVLPQAWTSLKTYETYRRERLRSWCLRMAARLGSGAFSAISGEVVQCVLSIESRPPEGLNLCVCFDVSGIDGVTKKSDGLKAVVPTVVPQVKMVESPSARISFAYRSKGDPLGVHAASLQGISPADLPRFTRAFWELQRVGAQWDRVLRSPDSAGFWRGRDLVLRWDGELQEAVRAGKAYIRGDSAWGHDGVAVSQTGNLPATLYAGERFLTGAAVVIPKAADDLLALWAFLSDPTFSEEVRGLDQKVMVTNGTLTEVPIAIDGWRAVAAERFPNGLPEPFSDDPTQWLFRGVVAGSRFPLQVAAARLLGFSWPDQEPDAVDALADADGIVCLPALGGEPDAGERLRQVLESAYGDEWNSKMLDALLSEVGAKPGVAGLDKWLRDGFFKDHCKVFANRPFIWQIWDGRPDGFSALVNYHRLDRKLLERLTYDYLGSWWIGRLNEEIRNEVPGAEARLVAAQELKDKLALILEGEPPYDIYVRWKSAAEQPKGWEPDLDDGVRLNIRPFMTAGVLRAKPNIKWEKDRGKNPDGSERFNDPHYTLTEKQAAQGAQG